MINVEEVREVAVRVIERNGFRADRSYSGSDARAVRDRELQYVVGFADACSNATPGERAALAAALSAPTVFCGRAS